MRGFASQATVRCTGGTFGTLGLVRVDGELRALEGAYGHGEQGK